MEPYDAFDLLANLLFANSLIDPNRYKESTHEGLSVAVEYVALMLVMRGRRGGATPDRWIPGEVLREIVADSRALVRAGALVNLKHADPSSQIGRLRFSVLNKRLFLRHNAFEAQERQLLDSLFGGEDFDPVMKELFGWTVNEAQSIFDAFRSAPLISLRHRFSEAVQAAVESRIEAPGLDEDAIRRRFAKLPRYLRDAAAAFAWAAVGDTISMTIAEIAERSHVSETAVRRFIGHFSMPFGFDDDPSVDRLHGFLAGYNPFLKQPLIDDRAGNILCIGPGLLLFALRPVIQTEIYRSIYRDRFDRRRRRHQETAVAGLIRSAMKPDVLETNLHYEWGEEIPELDVLAVLGPVAIVAEAKGQPMTEAAARAAPKTLSRDLRAIISKGTAQADRVRALIERDRGLTVVQDRGGTRWLDLSQVEIVITMVATLEDLSGIATDSAELREIGVITPGEQIPIVVSLHDLEIICDLAEFPAQFLHYLIRRGEIARLAHIVAADELDYLGLYLEQGLYLREPLGGPEPPSGIFLESMTDEIDAYYMYKHGVRQKPAKRPRQHMPGLFRKLLEWLEQKRPAGFIEGSLQLLDLAGNARQQIHNQIHRVRVAARQSGGHHDTSLPMDHGGFTIFGAPTFRARQEQTLLDRYCQCKRYQRSMPSWTGIGLTVDDDIWEFASYVHVKAPFRSREELSQICKELGLSPDSNIAE